MPVIISNCNDLDTNYKLENRTMKLIYKISKFLAFVACLALTTNSFARATDSPVGTWEVAVSGGASGVGYLTFNSDNSFEGYGISKTSYGLVEYEGTWAISNNKIVGTYTEYLDGFYLSNGYYSGTAKVGTSISLAALVSGKSYKFKGKPTVSLTDISGSYAGTIKQLGYTGSCNFSVEPSGSLGLFLVTGSVSVPGIISYTFDGYIILDGIGNIIICSDSSSSSYPSSTWGKIKNGGTTKLKGYQQDQSSFTLTFAPI